MKYIHYLYVCLVAAVLFACQEEDMPGQSGKTGFLISLTDGTEVAVSRVTPGELVESLPIKPADFHLTITNSSTDELVYDGKVSEELIKVKAGVYNLAAAYGENPVLALDAPYFKGEVEKAIVKGGETTSVEIPCKVANSLLSVTFDNSKESFEGIYSDYYAEVKVGGESVALTKDGKESAYFRSGSTVEVVFHGTLKEGGEEKSVPLDLGDVKNPLEAGDHLRLTLMPELDKYDIPLSVAAAEVVTATLEETIPVSWLPKPKVSAEGFDENNTLNMYESECPIVKFNFDLSSALQELKFTLNFEDETYKYLNRTYILSELSLEDKNILTNAGIILPQIGLQKASFDLTNLVAKFTGSIDGTSLANTIVLDEVKANNRILEGDQKYIINTSAPEFGMVIYPGDTWTKQFTVSTEVIHGNADVIGEKMIYEYSLDGSVWNSSAESLITDLVPGTNYQVRGKFGKHYSEVVNVKTYEHLVIPNSNLDGGYDTSYPKSNNPLYTFKGGWVDTRNEQTCHSSGVNAFYVSKSSTLPVNDNGSVVAHMMVIGWGKGNTCNFGKKSGSVINNISSGFVCVGDYDVNSDAVIAKPAYIRPTSLEFTYKASPYNGDEYLIEVTMLNIEDGIETVVGEGKLQSGAVVDEYSTETVEIKYNDLAKELPISHVKILFKAGTKEDKDHLENEFRDASIWDGYANAYIMGSQFWLDSFNLIYRY